MEYTHLLNKSHLALLSDGLNEEICSNIVHIGDQDGAVLWGEFGWIHVLLHSGAPVDPLTLKNNEWICV